ncbi:hypothetical protein B0T19DRAFT_436764 [Cercophora scortea]|uniref:Uncharacterized protein n=1 Tax=Cercophora scortea TaxID=314031 RepID=A0AAE0J2V9_9PEZI|nr:hypothetical protein B0T19DRAFT_436764 [Cercophora scortea]
MQQPGLGLLPPRNYEYSAQPTEDHEDRDISQDLHEDGPSSKKGFGAAAAAGSQQRTWQAAAGKGKGKGKGKVKGPDYKPTALRWPFIGAVVVLLCVAIALIVYAEKAMPGSDSDAEILGLSPSAAKARARHLQAARADSAANESTISSVPAASTAALAVASSSLTVLLPSTTAALTTDTSGVPSTTAAFSTTIAAVSSTQEQQSASSSASIASVASTSETFTETVTIHDASSTTGSSSSAQSQTDSQTQTIPQSQTDSQSQTISPSQTASQSQTNQLSGADQLPGADQFSGADKLGDFRFIHIFIFWIPNHFPNWRKQLGQLDNSDDFVAYSDNVDRVFADNIWVCFDFYFPKPNQS